MKVIIKPAFKRDREKVSDTALLEALFIKLEQIETAQRPQNITGLKPLTELCHSVPHLCENR